jgi:hypothetical protein
MSYRPAKQSMVSSVLTAVAAVIGLGALGSSTARSGETPTVPSESQSLKDGTIAYLVTDMYWDIYSKDFKTECPHGINKEGNREEFKQLFPKDGTKWTIVDTQLRREVDSWYPTTAPDPFPFYYAQGPISYGMNLDGKIGPNDFTSPDGVKGVDNNLYRVLGCEANYRLPSGVFQVFDQEEVPKEGENRILLELSGVHSLVNDDDVQVTMYRGRDPILMDATGKNAAPGGSERIDTHWGAKYIQHLHGRIVNGVLTTEPLDLLYPWAVFNIATDEYMRGARFQLKLTSTNADGILAGYTDIQSWYAQLMRSYSTHHQSYGQQSAPSLYKALRRMADGYPDPKSGGNTAISSALGMNFVQVYILPSSKALAAKLPAQHYLPFLGQPDPRVAADEANEYTDYVSRKDDVSRQAPKIAATAAQPTAAP